MEESKCGTNHLVHISVCVTSFSKPLSNFGNTLTKKPQPHKSIQKYLQLHSMFIYCI